MIFLRTASLLAAASFMVSACASDRIDYGGTMSPVAVPDLTGHCDDWERTQTVAPEYPDELAFFLRMAQRNDTSYLAEFKYDITPAGETANIEFVEPSYFLSHEALKSAILAGGEAIDEWRFSHTGYGPPLHAENCRSAIDFLLGWREHPR